MPNPDLNWTITANNHFSSSIDLDTQFREAFFAIKELYKSAGWTVVESSKGDGATFGSGSDVIATAADVGIGAAGAGAWISLRSPAAGWMGSDQVEVLFYVDDLSPAQIANTQFTPVGAGGYTGGTAVALPTAALETVVNTLGNEIVPWNAPIAGNYIAGFTDRGDIQFFVKPTGIDFLRFHYTVRANDASNGGGKGGYRFFHHAVHGAGTVMSISFLGSASYKRYLAPTGVVGTNQLEADCTCWNINSWPDGRDFEGEGIDVDIDLYSDSASFHRYFGKWVDLRGAPSNLPWAELDDTETGQTYRKYGVGSVWIYVPSAALPLA
jgi:hypothetical protein